MSHPQQPSTGAATSGTGGAAPTSAARQHVHHAQGRPPWSPPRGRELLAGITLVAVLAAILFVFTNDVAPPPRTGVAEALLRPASAAAAPGRPAPAWSDVPVVARPADLGPGLAGPVAEGLAASRLKIARCVAAERRRSGFAGARRGAPAELVLNLFTRTGAVHVDSVEVTAAGGAPELPDCARRLLPGDSYPAAGAAPGRRHRLAIALE